VLLRQAENNMSKDDADAAGNGRSTKLGTKPVLDRQVQVHIGRKLKAVYDEVAAEPLPKEILELLAKLEGRSTE
jgi:hypothetical protein